MPSPAPQRFIAFAAEFDARFASLLSPSGDVPAGLGEAVRHSAMAPGKRIRPYLVVRCCELVGGNTSDAWAPAIAIECVHTFSLIHDDLPAMDDDDLRRGRPTCHRVFGEANAILAGDALVFLAFETIAREVAEPRVAAEMVRELAEASGWTGMIGGQAADLAGEHQPPAVSLVEFIHGRKTARLFAAACRLGALAGRAPEPALAALAAFGDALGRAFQIADDLLDVVTPTERLGKTAGKDERAGKQTLPRSVGIESSRLAAGKAADTAVAALAPFGPAAADLRELARFVVDRDY